MSDLLGCVPSHCKRCLQGSPWTGLRRRCMWEAKLHLERSAKVRLWGLLVTIPNLEWKSYPFVQCSSWEFALQETISTADFAWMYLEREGLKPAMNRRRMPGFLETSPKPNNFSEFSEAPEECLHFNGKSSESSENYSQFYFFIERQKPLLWIRHRSIC